MGSPGGAQSLAGCDRLGGLGHRPRAVGDAAAEAALTRAARTAGGPGSPRPRPPPLRRLAPPGSESVAGRRAVAMPVPGLRRPGPGPGTRTSFDS